jgi:hypothetical protein
MIADSFPPFLKKNPIGVGCGLLAVLLIAGAYYRSSAVPELNELLDQKLTERARVAANVKNATGLTDQLARLTRAQKGIEDRLVHASELAKNLQYFYRLEAETGTKLLELHQNPSSLKVGAPKTAFNGVSFTVTFQGDYLAILDVFRRLERGTHYSRVLSASLMTIGPDRTGPLKLSLGLELLGQP